MSGSGPTVFGIFPDEQTALGCQAVLKAQGEARQVYITETFNQDNCSIETYVII